MPFKDRFKELRKEMGLTQKEMADKYNLGLSTVQRYEKGVSVPGGMFLIDLAMEGFNLHWIMTGDGDKYKFNTPSTTPIFRDLWEWLEEISEDDPGKKEWFRVQIELSFPSFREWQLRKKEGKN